MERLYWIFCHVHVFIFSPSWSEVVQSLRDGNATRCPAVESNKAIKTIFPGNVVRLPCKPGSNLAQVQWSVNNHTIENSIKYHIHHNSLLILNASDSDAGFYTCTSVEFSNGEDYVTQKASYELRLGNFIMPSSVQPQEQEQQDTLVALNIIVIILTLILLVLVVWNFYKGHLVIPRCPDKAKEAPQSVSVCQEPLQIVNSSKATSIDFSSNRNNNHNRNTGFPNTANHHNENKLF